MVRSLGLVLCTLVLASAGMLGLVASCGPVVEPPAATDAGGEASAATSSGTTATDDGTRTAGSDATTSTSSTAGEPFDDEAFREMCEAIETQDECDAAASIEIYDDPAYLGAMRYFWCTWETWVPVERVGDDCVFGPVTATCVGRGPDGPNCSGESVGWRSGGPTGVEVGSASYWCTVPEIHCVYSTDPPPECDCLYDADWPGLPPSD